MSPEVMGTGSPPGEEPVRDIRVIRDIQISRGICGVQVRVRGRILNRLGVVGPRTVLVLALMTPRQPISVTVKAPGSVFDDHIKLLEFD